MKGPTRHLAIESLFLPVPVTAYAADVDEAWITQLHDDERDAIAPMGTNRRAEFATGRACARAALTDLGLRDPVRREGRGAPRWPVGVFGSISHSGGRCIGVATTANAALGIDIESIARVKPAIERRILVDAERDWLADFDGESRSAQVAAIFAAKEAFYKAHYALHPRYLGFDAVAVRRGHHDQLLFESGHRGADPASVERAGARVRFEDGLAIVGVAITAR